MSDPEKDSYTVDEMLSRLRSRHSSSNHDDDGQLVTRSDGSQAIRVRKRKRRSRQPHKEAEGRRRKRNLMVASLIVGVVLAISLSLVGWMFYLNTSAFQKGVESKLEAWTGARIEMTRFRTTPVSVGADAITATWPEDSPVVGLKLQQLRGDLKVTSHLGGRWTGDELRATAGALVLRAAPEAGKVNPAPPAGELPFRLPVTVGSLNVFFGDRENPALRLSDAEARFNVPDPALRASSVVLQGGRFRMGAWGVYLLDFASVHLRPDGVRVGSIQFHPEVSPDSMIRLSGEDLPALQLRGGPNELRLGLQDLPSVPLLGNELGRLVDARFETPEGMEATSLCSFDLTDGGSIRISAPLRGVVGSKLHLHGLPCFDAIARELGNPRLAQPGFESQVRATLQRDKDSSRLEGLQLVSRDNLQVSGSIGVSKGRLEGELEIGLPEAGVVSSPTLSQVFVRAASGMRWATVRLGGSARKPSDDFADRLDAARLEVSPAEGGQPALEDEFRELTTPGGGR